MTYMYCVILCVEPEYSVLSVSDLMVMHYTVGFLCVAPGKRAEW